MNAALNTEGVLEIGEVGLTGVEVYNIGAIAFLCCDILFLDDTLESVAVGRGTNEGADWFSGENFLPWGLDEGKNWAVFTPVPEPNMALLTVAALATLGVFGRRRRKGRLELRRKRQPPVVSCSS